MPNASKSNSVYRNSNKFLREREVLAEFPLNVVPSGVHTFNFNFVLGANFRKPPTVNVFQEIKGFGILNLRSAYKISVYMYDASNRADKLFKKEYPIVIREPMSPGRMNFIEVGQSEVLSCFGSLFSSGISSFRVKCPKDVFKKDE